MGFMDKVKSLGEAGKEKLDTVQAKRQADALFRDLGAAYYAARAGRGDQQLIEDLVGKLQAHEAEHGQLSTAQEADGGAAAPQQAPYAQQPMGGGIPQGAPMGGGMPQAAPDPMAAGGAPPAGQSWGAPASAPAAPMGMPQSAPDPMAPPAAPMGMPQSAPDPMAPPAAEEE